jgi:mannitol/fructose-specific phosphotransferase system IIA component (Ntr-type)/CBS domain-containing protein
MKLANLLIEDRINVNLKARTKDEAIVELLDMLREQGIGVDYEAVLASVREREEVEDTAYGHGFAFPHARTDAVKELYILVGISKKGLEGKTADGVPLHVVCLLLTPSTIAKLYLQMLAGLARLARTDWVLERLLSTDSKREFIRMVAASNVTIDKDLLVRDVMRHKVVSVTPDDTVKDVADRMFRNRLSALAVVDENNRMLGVINDRDVIKAALPDFERLVNVSDYVLDFEPFEELLRKETTIKVAQLYRTDHENTSPDTRIVEIAAKMIFKDIRRAFVVENDQLVGILLRRDIVNMIIRG